MKLSQWAWRQHIHPRPPCAGFGPAPSLCPLTSSSPGPSWSGRPCQVGLGPWLLMRASRRVGRNPYAAEGPASEVALQQACASAQAHAEAAEQSLAADCRRLTQETAPLEKDTIFVRLLRGPDAGYWQVVARPLGRCSSRGWRPGLRKYLQTSPCRTLQSSSGTWQGASTTQGSAGRSGSRFLGSSRG